MKLTIPEFSLVVLIGPSGSGKSTFARQHFKQTKVLASDFCRGLVSDDENDQTATHDAFEVLHFIATKRLASGKLTVIDATNVKAEDRKPLLALARKYHCLPVAIVLNLPERVCRERNRERPDRNFGQHVVRQQRSALRRSLRGLKREGFRYIYVLTSPEEVEAVTVDRQPLWTNLKAEHGPFDIIGDIHGCFDELTVLLNLLGYQIIMDVGDGSPVLSHPDGRKAVFLGDLVDRGPNVSGVLRLVMGMVNAGCALCIPGNHDVKLLRALRGRNVQVTHGLDLTLGELEQEPAEFKAEVATFIDRLISHYVLDDGKLVVAHAGMKEALQGRASGAVRDFALYGDTTGETDEFGLPIRQNWAEEYRGRAMVVYGHTPVSEAEWLNGTINIDTGCVFGGKLTALRYPERELVSVPAVQTYYESPKPFLQDGTGNPSPTLVETGNPSSTPIETGNPSPTPVQQRKYDNLLDIEDVLGKRVVSTRFRSNVTIREENAVAALEIMSRFAVNPSWLVYLPPTMSPTETTNTQELLEHPAEAFAYYRREGVPSVICEEKHMGSRAVVIVCRDPDVAAKRFGVPDDGVGICYTRTGRRFFDSNISTPQREIEAELLAEIQSAMEAGGIFETLNTDWVVLDCELMPWSVKAQELLRQQYAPVGVASRIALKEAVAVLEQASGMGLDELDTVLTHYRSRAETTTQYVNAYRNYCWPVDAVTDLKLAPFHILATEGAVHINKDHLWHMETLAKLCRENSPLHATAHKVIDVTDAASQDEGIRWWEELTNRGGEGMVVKPLDFVARGKRGIVQPAIKCRGREYLRIIYGPEYTLPDNLEALRARGLSAKRSLALREFALGIEALERFVRREPLYRVHECVFGVLALESEPVDPRL